MTQRLNHYSREMVERAYLLAERGLRPSIIGTQLGVSRDAVSKWLRHPETFSPFLDEIAIERALHGERQVYDNLSRFERREFWSRVRAMATAQRQRQMEKDEPLPIYGRLASFWGVEVKRVKDLAQRAA
jgi:predicted transcriptional regulator